MMKAIRAALAPCDAQDRMRVVCFMTDGEVGNDMEIIAEVQKHPNARVFAFGIGSSVNHFLLDKMARYGRGEVEYVGLKDDGSAAARRFHERVHSPLLTDISIDWGGLPVTGVYPARIPDLFAAKPLVVSGRYAAPGARRNPPARQDGRPRLHSRDPRQPARLPAGERRAGHAVGAPPRRRPDVARISAACSAAPCATISSSRSPSSGIDYRLMTQFTSFVAVEEKTVTEGGTPRRVEVPVEMPEGMSYEGVFGKENRLQAASASMGMMVADRTFIGSRVKAMPAATTGGASTGASAGIES